MFTKGPTLSEDLPGIVSNFLELRTSYHTHGSGQGSVRCSSSPAPSTPQRCWMCKAQPSMRKGRLVLFLIHTMIQHNYSWRMCGSHMGKHPLQLHICSITAEPSSRTAPSKLCVRRPQFPFEREAPAGARAIDGSPATLCAISLSTPLACP